MGLTDLRSLHSTHHNFRIECSQKAHLHERRVYSNKMGYTGSGFEVSVEVSVEGSSEVGGVLSVQTWGLGASRVGSGTWGLSFKGRY